MSTDKLPVFPKRKNNYLSLDIPSNNKIRISDNKTEIVRR